MSRLLCKVRCRVYSSGVCAAQTSDERILSGVKWTNPSRFLRRIGFKLLASTEPVFGLHLYDDSKFMFQSSDFTIATAHSAAEALQAVLASRVHVKRVHGQEFVTPGTLGEAVGLPRILHMLEGRSSSRREQGLTEFRLLWDTLSANTCEAVLERVGWYDPRELDWEDPRSNRQPSL